MGYRIKIVFEDFNLPANHDCKQLFLNIAEGDSTGAVINIFNSENV